MRHARCRLVVVLIFLIAVAGVSPVAAAPDGQMIYGVHVSLAPTWFDPAEAPRPRYATLVASFAAARPE